MGFPLVVVAMLMYVDLKVFFHCNDSSLFQVTEEYVLSATSFGFRLHQQWQNRRGNKGHWGVPPMTGSVYSAVD